MGEKLKTYCMKCGEITVHKILKEWSPDAPAEVQCMTDGEIWIVLKKEEFESKYKSKITH